MGNCFYGKNDIVKCKKCKVYFKKSYGGLSSRHSCRNHRYNNAICIDCMEGYKQGVTITYCDKCELTLTT